MKYHDSIKIADKIMVLAVAQLKKWQLAINPINYAVVYEYYKKSNLELTKSIEKELALNEFLSGFFMENLYKEQVLEQSNFREEIITDLSILLNEAYKNQTHCLNSSDNLLRELDHHIPQLHSQDNKQVKRTIVALEEALNQFKVQKNNLSSTLEIYQKESERLTSELAQVRQEINLDPITGLFNKKAIASHLTSWHQQHSPCSISAIIIKITDFHQVEKDFGVLFTDIILSKIANKIASYVNDSGLPVRLNYDEFILFLPQIDNKIASEIGIKIRQGIQRMRFVSVRSDIKLPQINVDFSVNRMKEDDDIDDFINDSRLLLTSIN
jgi:diguanylate cyclase